MSVIKFSSRCFLASFRYLSQTKIQKTHVFRHYYIPERTPDGMHQRNPTDKQQFEKYELLEIEDEKPIGDLKVILLEDIDGIGLQFDVVEVNRELGRNNLILLKKAAYASPFNLTYYAKKKENMQEILSKRIRIPYNYLKLGRTLLNQILPIFVSMDNSWEINKAIVLSALIQKNIEHTPDSVYLPETKISGPDLSLEAKLIRIYILIEKQYVVPILGRITHISSESFVENLYPSEENFPTPEKLKNNGLRVETPYYFQQKLNDDFDLVKFMEGRKEE